MRCATFTCICLLLVFDRLAIVLPAGYTESCSSFCVCDIWYGLQRASCTERHLYSIHTGASADTQALDLSNNSISILNSNDFLDVGLTRLKYLNLSENSIGEIDLNAFRNLTDLAVVDLSKNHLYYLLADTFIENKNLRVLRLTKNNLNLHVPKLRSPSLTDLSIDSCQISHIPRDTFVGLERLRNLDLSNNLMIQLDNNVLQTLHFLRKLSLEGNPWSCNKNMYDLQIYLKQRSIEFNKICELTTGSKMLEKMIRLDAHPKQKVHVTLDKETTKILQTDVTDTANRKNTSSCVNADDREAKFTNVLNAISPYWFFAIGFIFGNATSMVICYIWLSRTFGCCRRDTHHARASNDPQRISLLQNLWQFEDSPPNESSDQIVSCPGTPPPPYHEVLIYPSLYPRRSAVSNLNSDLIRYNT